MVVWYCWFLIRFCISMWNLIRFCIIMYMGPGKILMHMYEVLDKILNMYEGPDRVLHIIAQCKRCQRYGYTKTYCTLTSVCVKCGNEQDNRQCTKEPDAPPKRGLCGGDHTANYQSCPEYKSAIKNKPAPGQKNSRNSTGQIRNRVSGTEPELSPSQRTHPVRTHK